METIIAKAKSEVNFFSTYVSNKATNGVTIRTAVIIGSTGKRLMKQGGFDVQIGTLPQCDIDNPMFSLTAATYLRKTWMYKPALWSRSIVHMIDCAKDMRIDDRSTNQAAEQQEFSRYYSKNEEEVKKTCMEIARHLRQRWDNSLDEERVFVQQLKTIEARVEMRLNGRKKRSAITANLEARIEEDKKARLETAHIDPEMEVGEVWGSSSSKPTHIQRNLVDEISSLKGEYSWSNAKAYIDFKAYSKGKIMSYNTFNNFVNLKKSVLGKMKSYGKQLRPWINHLNDVVSSKEAV